MSPESWMLDHLELLISLIEAGRLQVRVGNVVMQHGIPQPPSPFPMKRQGHAHSLSPVAIRSRLKRVEVSANILLKGIVVRGKEGKFPGGIRVECFREAADFV
jgi:hypothetical protein